MNFYSDTENKHLKKNSNSDVQGEVLNRGLSAKKLSGTWNAVKNSTADVPGIYSSSSDDQPLVDNPVFH